MKIVAEIKNKYNTTSNHMVAVYDAVKSTLKIPACTDYTGYVVEIIPKGKKPYDKSYTPSDNKTKKGDLQIKDSGY